MKYVDKRPDGCWVWNGCISQKDGYGMFRYNKKMIHSHRMSYLIEKGHLPIKPLIVRHKCITKSCCNPEHLEPGTYKDNENDKRRDGTLANGEKQHLSKLTVDIVRDIRRRSNDNHRTLAEEFGVNISTIEKVIYRTTWKHI